MSNIDFVLMCMSRCVCIGRPFSGHPTLTDAFKHFFVNAKYYLHPTLRMSNNFFQEA